MLLAPIVAMAAAALAAAAAASGSTTSAGAGVVEAGALYRQAGAPIAERVADLLKRMTLEEKVNQTLNDFYAGAFGPGVPADPAGQMAIASEGMRYMFKFCAKTDVGSDADVEACISAINHFQTLEKFSLRF